MNALIGFAQTGYLGVGSIRVAASSILSTEMEASTD